MAIFDISAYINNLDQISSNLHQQEQLIDISLLQRFESQAQTIKDNTEHNYQEGRTLSIGVMGAMKAGKSSFLNALLFNGAPVLPKAATPMTAALTKISYAPEASASITFISSAEWNQIQSACQKFEQEAESIYQNELEQYKKPQHQKMPQALQSKFKPKAPNLEEIKLTLLNRSEELRAYLEIRDQINRSKLDVYSYLGNTIELNASNNNWDEILNQLEDYVGANGRFTPLVKETHLKINNDLLKGLEIIDTPGLNDPFTSRSSRTKAYLGKCDVVLYLCQVSQFITAQDVEFICRDMRDNATADAYIIGTQLDSGIMQYQSNVHKFMTAYNGSKQAYNNQVNHSLTSLQNDSPVISSLRQKTPLYTSSMMFNIGQKRNNNEPLTQDEAFILEGLKNQFHDFDQVFETPQDFIDFSNIETIRNTVITEIRKKKEQLIQEKNSSFIISSTKTLLDCLDAIYQDTNVKISGLLNQQDSPQENLQIFLDNLNQVKSEIAYLIRNHALELQKKTEVIKASIAKAMANFEHIKTHKETSSYSETSGWIFKTTTVHNSTTYKADTTDVINNLKNYAFHAQELINQDLSYVNNKDALLKNLTNCMMSVFDLSDRKFNRFEIITPIASCLGGFEIRPLQIDFLEESIDEFCKQFPSSCVTGEQVHELSRAQLTYLNKILNILLKDLDQRAEDITMELNKQSVDLCQNIKEKLQRKCDEMEQMCKDRELYLGKLNTLLKILDEGKVSLTNL